MANMASAALGPDMFCFCVVFSQGLPWSESLEGMTFSEWMESFFGQQGAT